MARAQTVTTTASATAWTGTWVLDESRSDPPLMGVLAPRQSRWQPTTQQLVAEDRTFAVERRADSAVVRRVFSRVDGEPRTAGSTVSHDTWTTKGPVFETWEEVALPLGSDTVYECRRWTRDTSGARWS